MGWPWPCGTTGAPPRSCLTAVSPEQNGRFCSRSYGDERARRGRCVCCQRRAVATRDLDVLKADRWACAGSVSAADVP